MNKVQEYAMHYNITNPLTFGAVEEGCFEKNVEDTGYTRKTTFYSDLSIAEWCDYIAGAKDTHKRVMKDWINDYVYITEYIMCLNHKCWEWYEKDDELSNTYRKLYEEAYYKAQEHFEGNQEALRYMFQTLD